MNVGAIDITNGTWSRSTFCFSFHTNVKTNQSWSCILDYIFIIVESEMLHIMDKGTLNFVALKVNLTAKLGSYRNCAIQCSKNLLVVVKWISLEMSKLLFADAGDTCLTVAFSFYWAAEQHCVYWSRQV